MLLKLHSIAKIWITKDIVNIIVRTLNITSEIGYFVIMPVNVYNNNRNSSPLNNNAAKFILTKI